jgi:hypothetical protein
VRVVFLSSLLLASLAFAIPAHAVEVRTAYEGLVVVGDDGRERALTTVQGDDNPALSPDGRTVVFVRHLPGDPAHPDEAGPTELWTIGIDGSGATRVLAERASDRPEQQLVTFNHPVFALDGRSVYVLSAAWVTSDAIHRLDLASGKITYVAPGNSLRVVRAGRWAGHLVADQHRYHRGGGSYDDFWLLKPDGRAVRDLGDDPSAVDAYLREDVSGR